MNKHYNNDVNNQNCHYHYRSSFNHIKHPKSQFGYMTTVAKTGNLRHRGRCNFRYIRVAFQHEFFTFSYYLSFHFFLLFRDPPGSNYSKAPNWVLTVLFELLDHNKLLIVLTESLAVSIIWNMS